MAASPDDAESALLPHPERMRAIAIRHTTRAGLRTVGVDTRFIFPRRLRACTRESRLAGAQRASNVSVASTRSSTTGSELGALS